MVSESFLKPQIYNKKMSESRRFESLKVLKSESRRSEGRRSKGHAHNKE